MADYGYNCPGGYRGGLSEGNRWRDKMLNDLWPDDPLDDDDSYEYEEDYEDDNEPIIVRQYDVYARPFGAETITVGFHYEEETPLPYLLDEISNYVEDNYLQSASILSMHTEVDENGSFLVVVTFELEAE